MLNFMLNLLSECAANPCKLLKDMVGPWGLEPQTSTVSNEISSLINSGTCLQFEQLTTMHQRHETTQNALKLRFH